MEHSISLAKTFRYEVNQIGENPTFVLYALHGYGQLVKYFIRKFQQLEQSCIVVAPEGMHRFYLKGSSGRVGASWMTKEAREVDISDTNRFLDALRIEIKQQYDLPEILLGFSQGGASAARWNQTAGNFHAQILWGCVFPPDIEKEKIHTCGKGNDFFVLGNQDEYFNSEAQEKIKEFYESIDYTIITFAGNHDIHLETLNEIIRRIDLSK